MTKGHLALVLLKVEKDTKETHWSIQFTKVAWNPNFSRTTLRNPQFTMSYAFWRSTFIATNPPFTFLFLKLWSNSYTMTWFSAIHRPGMNADWHGDNNFGSTCLSLDTISLDIALYTMLHEDYCFWGIGTMRDWFTSWRIFPWVKRLCIALVTSALTIFQYSFPLGESPLQ